MHKNTFKPLCMLAAITLAFGISTSSAHAADTDLSITQKIDKITGKESQQKYTINYTDENKNTALKIEYDRGFYAKELKVGDWDNYTGKIKITAYSKDTKSPVMTTVVITPEYEEPVWGTGYVFPDGYTCTTPDEAVDHSVDTGLGYRTGTVQIGSIHHNAVTKQVYVKDADGYEYCDGCNEILHK